MKYNVEELESLKSTLENSRRILKDKNIIKLNGMLHKFCSSFNRLFTTMSSEKIINIDPYGEEYNLDNLELPDRSEIDYNEEEYTISIRLTHYNALLNYIKDNEILDLDKLTIGKIEKIEKIIKFMDWDRIFDPQPIEINTEALNKVLFNYQKVGSQSYATTTLKDSVANMHSYSDEFIIELEPIKFYINEKYKFLIRKEILKLVKLPSELQGQNIKKAHDLISYKISELKKPLHIELVGEILMEDFSDEGEIIRKEIALKLESLDPINAKKSRETNKQNIGSPIELLQKTLLNLSKVSSQISSIAEKARVNSETFRDKNYSFIEKLIDYLKFNILGTKRNTIYTLKITNTTEENPKNKSIEFEKFISGLKSLDKTLKNYKDAESKEYKELFDKEEKDVQIKIHKLLSKCRHEYKILDGLDRYFKDSLKSSKGIQIELKVVLSAIDASQTTYFEYTKLKSDGQKKTTYKPGTNLAT